MEKAQIRIIRSKRKTVALEIRPDLSVLVRAPYWMADWQIRKFVDEKSDWLYAHLREMEQKQKLEAARPKAAPLTPGELQVLADEALRVIPERVRFMPGCRRDLWQDHHTKPAYTLGKLQCKGQS